MTLLQKPTGSKYITRVDYPESSIKGYVLRCMMSREPGQGRFYKYFSARNYGGMRGAKTAAILLRGKWWMRLSKANKILTPSKPRQGKIYGKGVYRWLKTSNGTTYWIATWCDNGIQQRKYYSIKKYGNHKAKALAQKYRNIKTAGREHG